MSFFIFTQGCKGCGEKWESSFGIVGTSQIGSSRKTCPKCGSSEVETVPAVTPQAEPGVSEPMEHAAFCTFRVGRACSCGAGDEEAPVPAQASGDAEALARILDKHYPLEPGFPPEVIRQIKRQREDAIVAIAEARQVDAQRIATMQLNHENAMENMAEILKAENERTKAAEAERDRLAATLGQAIDALEFAHNKAYILYHTPKAVSKQCRVDIDKLFKRLSESIDYLVLRSRLGR